MDVVDGEKHAQIVLLLKKNFFLPHLMDAMLNNNKKILTIFYSLKNLILFYLSFLSMKNKQIESCAV